MTLERLIFVLVCVLPNFIDLLVKADESDMYPVERRLMTEHQIRLSVLSLEYLGGGNDLIKHECFLVIKAIDVEDVCNPYLELPDWEDICLILHPYT